MKRPGRRSSIAFAFSWMVRGGWAATLILAAFAAGASAKPARHATTPVLSP